MVGGSNPLGATIHFIMPDPQDNVLNLLKKSEEFLKKKNIPSARLDAELLLADLLKIPRVKLYVDFERPLSTEEKDAYRERIVERSRFRPTAYIIGRKAFFDSDFFIDNTVLIPRPETEELVAWILEEFPDKNSRLKFLDLCSGSGCIGISLAKARADWSPSFSDISQEASKISERNGLEILGNERTMDFFIGDLLAPVPTILSFDFIVANPPYIPESEKTEIMQDVIGYEPHIALFVSNFKEFHAKLLKETLAYLPKGGKLYLETHPEYSQWLSGEALSVGYSEALIRKDLSHKNRFLRLTK